MCVVALAQLVGAKPTQIVVFGDSLADDGGARSFRNISQSALAQTFEQPVPYGQGLGESAAIVASQPFVSAPPTYCGSCLGWSAVS